MILKTTPLKKAIVLTLTLKQNSWWSICELALNAVAAWSPDTLPLHLENDKSKTQNSNLNNCMPGFLYTNRVIQNKIKPIYHSNGTDTASLSLTVFPSCCHIKPSMKFLAHNRRRQKWYCHFQCCAVRTE